MARNEANLSFFMLVSNYKPENYEWTEEELAALGNCKATAEVIKKRLEDNGAKVKEMYVIEHKGEANAVNGFHNDTDETNLHYHILVRFEPSHGATLKEIAKYIGIRAEYIVKPHPGRYSYPNNLAYLTHIKYENKIQYDPKEVVTLAGTNYMDYFKEYEEKWRKARAIMENKGRKPHDRIFKEAKKKLESGEFSYRELTGIPEYRPLFFNAKYQRQLKKTKDLVEGLAQEDWWRLDAMISNKEISKEEAAKDENFKLALKYHGKDLPYI